MIICPTGNQPVACRTQCFAKYFGVGDNLRSVVAELGAQRLSKRHRLGRHDVHQRPALLAREHRLIHGRRQILVCR